MPISSRFSPAQPKQKPDILVLYEKATENGRVETASRIEGTVGRVRKVVSVFSDYRASPGDYVISVKSTGAARTVFLPHAASAGRGKRIVVEDRGGDAAANNITVTAIGSQTINGVGTSVIGANYGSVSVRSDGKNWIVE